MVPGSGFVVSAVAVAVVLAALVWPVLTQERMCPELYHLEQHVGDPNHGNVCRSDVAGNAFVCPRCCTATKGPPHCGNTAVAAAPCRAIDLSACTAAIAGKSETIQEVERKRLGALRCNGNTKLEEHVTSGHGDVCRGAAGSHSCPQCCISTGRAPYCIAGSITNSMHGHDHGEMLLETVTPEAPCRVKYHACGSPLYGPNVTFVQPGEHPAPRTVKWTLSLVLRTWKGDAALGMKAIRSIARVVPASSYDFNVVIITDTDSKATVERESTAAASKGFFYNAANYTVVVEPVMFYNGNIQQKYSKMTADLHTNAEYLLHIDSDVRFHAWNEHCFFGGGKDHKPLLEYAPWHFLPPVVQQWMNGSKALLGLDTVGFEFSRSNQHVYPRALYQKLRSRVETVEGMSFKDVFLKYPLVGLGDDMRHLHRNGKLGALLVSDFNLLGGYVHYFEPDLMNTIDVSVPRNPVNDPPPASCVSQCNSRIYDDACCEAWFDSMDEYQYGTSTQEVGIPGNDEANDAIKTRNLKQETGGFTARARPQRIQGYSCLPFLQNVAPTMCPFVERYGKGGRIVSRKYGIAGCTYGRMVLCTFKDKDAGSCRYNTTVVKRET